MSRPVALVFVFLMKNMMVKLKFVIAALLVSGSSCQGDVTMNFYAADQIENIEIFVNDNGSVNIDIRPVLETVYYLAGARVREVDGRSRLAFIRCSVGSQCEVDMRATVTASTPNPYRLTVENGRNPIDLEFSDGSFRNLYEPDT